MNTVEYFNSDRLENVINMAYEHAVRYNLNIIGFSATHRMWIGYEAAVVFEREEDE